MKKILLFLAICVISACGQPASHTFGAAGGTTTPISPASWSVPSWFVDPANSSGNASNNNNCTTAGTPCLTKAEIIYHRWGTQSPNITTTVTITYLSADVGGADPGIFRPNFVNGGVLVHTAPLPAAAFTGTLLAVTAKNVAANQALQSTFTTTTGAIAANMLLVNTTRTSSRAIVQRNISGGNWQISQPLAPYIPGTLQFPAENDTWANGDTINGFVPIVVNIPVIGGQAVGRGAGGFAPAHVVQQINITPFSGVGSVLVDFGSYPCIADSIITGNLISNPAGSNAGVFSNIWGCSITGQTQVSPAASNTVRIVGGIMSANGVSHGLRLEFDPILSTGILSFDRLIANGSVFCDTGCVLTVFGSSLAQSTKFYGGGTYNQVGGTTTYTSTAVSQFPLSGGLQLNGVATGYSSLTTAGTTVIHQLALTAANLDAAAGAAGFGGYAYGGGGTFSKAGVQP